MLNLNFKLIATKFGDGVKNTTTINEINRVANAIFNFQVEKHSPDSITSARAALIYDWIVTLDNHYKDVYRKCRLLDEFIAALSPEDSPLRLLTSPEEKPRSRMPYWSIMHPEVAKTSQGKFEDEYFADAVESAFKQVNKRSKDYVKNKTGRELDGASLMQTAFSLENPIIVLDDLNTESGRSIQKGYLQIFSGSIIGIRNPKAHENLIINKERAIHLLFLASLLMYKLDEAQVP